MGSISLVWWGMERVKKKKKSTRRAGVLDEAASQKKASRKSRKKKKLQTKAQRRKKKKVRKSKKKKPIRHQMHAALFVFVFRRIRLFKELLRTGVKPEFLSRLDLTTLKLEMGDLPNDKGYIKQVDLLFSVRLKGHRERIKIALLIEHKSRKSSTLVEQLLVYTIELKKKYKSIVPIVVTHDAMDLSDVLVDAGRQALGVELIRVPFLHIALSELSWDKLRGLASAAAMLVLGHANDFKKLSRKRQIEIVQQALQLLPKLKSVGRMSLVRQVLYYVKSVSPAMFKLLGEKALILKSKNLSPRVVKQIKEGLEMREKAESFLFDEDKFIQEGVKKGLQKGLQTGLRKGRQEGQDKILALMLKRGSMQDVARLTGLSVHKLRQIKKKAA